MKWVHPQGHHWPP